MKREFPTGATRDSIEEKPQYAGYLSPLVIQRFGDYMLKHQYLADGTTRAPDNWQRGIPQDVYLDSLLRHVVDVWLYHYGFEERATESLEDALCAIIFNSSGYLFEQLRKQCGL